MVFYWACTAHFNAGSQLNFIYGSICNSIVQCVGLIRWTYTSTPSLNNTPEHPAYVFWDVFYTIYDHRFDVIPDIQNFYVQIK